LRIYKDLNELATQILIGDISDPEDEREELAKVLGNRYDLWYQFKQVYIDNQVLTDGEIDAIKVAFQKTTPPPPGFAETPRRHSSADIRIPKPQPPQSTQPTPSKDVSPQQGIGPNERFFNPLASEQFADRPRPLQRSSSMPHECVNHRRGPSHPLRNFEDLSLDDRDEFPPSATAATEDSELPSSDDSGTTRDSGQHQGGVDPLVLEYPFLDVEKGLVPMEEVGKGYRKLFGGIVLPEFGHG
jgi:hypothetical protein